MRNTFFGDLPGRFEGSGARLFLRGILMWLLRGRCRSIVGLVATVGSIDWSAFGDLGGRRRDLLSWLESQRASPARPSIGPDLHLAAAVAGDSLSDLPGHGAALVGLRAALRRRRRDVAAAHGAGVRRLCSASSGMPSCSRWSAGAVVGAIVVRRDRRASPAGSTIQRRDRRHRRRSSASTSRSRSAIRPSIRRPSGSGSGGAWSKSLDLANLAVLDQVTAAGEPSSPVGEGLADALERGRDLNDQ